MDAWSDLRDDRCGLTTVHIFDYATHQSIADCMPIVDDVSDTVWRATRVAADSDAFDSCRRMRRSPAQHVTVAKPKASKGM